MNEKEALRELNYMVSLWEVSSNRKMLEALKLAVRSLEEIQVYKSIGSVEECRKAMERMNGI